jgi:hypothetical protein
VGEHEMGFEFSICAFVDAPMATIFAEGIGEGCFFPRHGFLNIQQYTKRES